MCDKWDGVSSPALQAKLWMSLSDLILVSEKRQWELQDIWTTDVKCNPPLSTVFVPLQTVQSPGAYIIIANDYRKWRITGTQAIHLQMGKETYRIRIIRQTRGGRSESEYMRENNVIVISSELGLVLSILVPLDKPDKSDNPRCLYSCMFLGFLLPLVA